MSQIELRAFRRSDRHQLTDLVNAHAAAVVPGLGVSVAAMLSHLEREPGEFIVDPWVSERKTLVGEQRDRVVAAAHLLRYAADERVGSAYRGIGEIHWLLFWPAGPASSNPHWSDGSAAADALIAACLEQFAEWRVTGQEAGGELPVPGVYGVPDQWPHIAALYGRAGFVHSGHTEGVYLAKIEDLPHPAGSPVPGLSVRRTVGLNGTRLTAVLAEQEIGYIEVEIHDEGERAARHGSWADVGNLHVLESYQRRGVATWLLAHAADWLRLAQVDRLFDYAWLEPDRDETGQDYAGYRGFLAAAGFVMLTRTRRGWTRMPREPQAGPAT